MFVYPTVVLQLLHPTETLSLHFMHDIHVHHDQYRLKRIKISTMIQAPFLALF